MTARRVVRVVKRVALYAAALAFTVFAVFPFYWMFVTAFKENNDLYVGGTVRTHVPWIFNDPPTLDHVQFLLHQTAYLTWVRNTVLVGAAVVLVTLVLAVPAGYALARLTVLNFTGTLNPIRSPISTPSTRSTGCSRSWHRWGNTSRCCSRRLTCSTTARKSSSRRSGFLPWSCRAWRRWR
jgi:hypothetical protein